MTRRLLLVSSLAVLCVAEPAPAAPDPKLGKTALVNAVSGKVKVREKGESGFEKLSASPVLVPIGSSIDATRGRVRIRTAGDGRGLDDGTFWKGAFELGQDKREAGAELRLLGESGITACPAPAPTVVRRLWGESDDPFRTVGWFIGVEAAGRKTRWLTEDKCNGTRAAVKRGTAQTVSSPLLDMEVEAGASVHQFCDYDGIEPVSGVFCTGLWSAPHLGGFGAAVRNQGDATAYDLCVTNPAGEEGCANYPLSEPAGPQGLRTSAVGCSTEGGPGPYSLRWLIEGVQLGPAFEFTSETPPGQDCFHAP